jgi:hypothetical protein
MKFLLLSLSLAGLFFGCKKDQPPDPATQFPGCIGIIGDFNPYSISKPYFVTLSGVDSLNVKIVFTKYEPEFLWVLTKWEMWIGVSNPTLVKYYGGFCTQYYGNKKWFGESGLDYNGQYAPLHFDFDIFTCNEVSGLCYLLVSQIPAAESQIPDTLRYSFVGTR